MSASATSPARAGRFCGSFSRQDRMTASSSSSISAPSVRGDCGSSWMIRYSTDCASPWNGGVPTTHSYSTTPSE